MGPMARQASEGFGPRIRALALPDRDSSHFPESIAAWHSHDPPTIPSSCSPVVPEKNLLIVVHQINSSLQTLEDLPVDFRLVEFGYHIAPLGVIG
jgi:hypothetical protein